MKPFWTSLLDPIVGALRPPVVVEDGVGGGELTAPLVKVVSEFGGVVHGIDPDPPPELDLDAIGAAYPGAFTFHHGRTLDVLPQLPEVDLALLDGDHNWSTVLRQLRILGLLAARPVIVVHDVDWPYGRRDMYLQPRAVPGDERQPYAYSGLVPDDPGLVDGGLNAMVSNATQEGGPRNGVRTAIEDFLEEQPDEWELWDVPGHFGLAVLAPEATIAENGRLRDLLASTYSEAFLRARCAEVEQDRIWAEIRASQVPPEAVLERSRAETNALQAAVAEATAERDRLRAELDQARAQPSHDRNGELERELLDATRQRAELEGRVAAHERELEALRREVDDERAAARATRTEARGAREDAEEGEASRSRLARRLSALEQRESELETELNAQRRTLREAGQALDDAEHRATVEQRRVEDLERELGDAKRSSAENQHAQTKAELRATALEDQLAEQAGALEASARALERQRRVTEDAEAAAAEAKRAAEAVAETLAARERELTELAENRMRLAADVADSRETLEQALEEARVRAETAQAAARELRERLEVRQIESDGLEEQLAQLREALTAARVEAEVARAHKAAADTLLAGVTAERDRLLGGKATSPPPARSPASPPLAEQRHPEPPQATPGSEPAAQLAPEEEPPAPTVPEEEPPAHALEEQPPAQPALEEQPPAPPAAVQEPPAQPAPVQEPPAQPALEPEPPPEPPARLSQIAFMETELQAHEDFGREYDGGLRAPGADPAVDARAMPEARDLRGFLRAEHDADDAGPTVDIVVCVHNALADVRLCLWSVAAKTDRPYRLVVVNDGSDEPTTTYLEDLVARETAIQLIHQADPPHGYTIAANLGLRAATGDYIVLLNSDTVVTYGWLDRIVECGESDPAIGILGPLSNAASHQSVPDLRDGGSWSTNPLPTYTTPDGVAKVLERLSPRDRPRIPFVNGFCYVVKRAVIDAIGYLDEELFASGYCEENDYSVRAGEAGFELAVVDDGYVFHAKSKSFGVETRKTIAKRNYELFLDKHGRERITAVVEGLESNTALTPLRHRVRDALSSQFAMAESLNDPSRPPLGVVFVLPGLGAGGSGGSHSIYQEVHGMRRLGVDARIALAAKAFDRARAAYGDADELFVPFRDVDELAQVTAGADVISATHFKSAELVAELRARRSDFLPAYYVQDYEPFFTSRESADVDEAIASYTLIEDCLLFAKTHWLCNIVSSRHGVHVAKVEPSIDESIYRPRDVRGHGPLRVAAMIRPRTPRRQPSAAVAVMEELSREFGGRIRVTPFGCSSADLERLTDHEPLLQRHRGLLSRQEVADLLGESDVFLDLSMYQAFGRTALEAMACGATAVVPRLGGVWEFLEHDGNGIAVDAFKPEQAFDALAALLDDTERLRRLQDRARETASRYSIMRAALSEYLVFTREHERRFGARTAA